MTYKFYWVSDDYKIEFSFEPNLQGNKAQYFVNVCLLYVVNSSNKKLIWDNVKLQVGDEGFVFHEIVEFEEVYCIQGSLKASFITNDKNSYLVIWGEFQYGKTDKLFNYTGSLVKIKIEDPPPPLIS